MKNILAFLIVMATVAAVSGQTIKVSYDDNNGFDDIPDTDITPGPFTLGSIPKQLRTVGGTPFTVKIDGISGVVTGKPGSARAGTARGNFVVNSATPSGIYLVGTPTTNSEVVKVLVNFTAKGYYTITTDVVNGIMFYATGYAQKAGTEAVTLSAIGTPSATGSAKFKISFAGSTIEFTQNIGGPATQTVVGTLTLQGDGSLDNPLKAGTITALSPIDPTANTLKVKTNITTAGLYNIVSDLKNGVFYFASGNIGSGNQVITLNAYGTPIAEGSHKLNLKFSATNVDYTVPVAPAVPDIVTYALPIEFKKIELISPAGTTYVLQFVDPNKQDIITNNPGSVYEKYISDEYGSDMKITSYGILMNAGATRFGGANFIHIFLDELGNSLYTSIPQGIPEMQYVVHIIYQKENASKKITYGIKATRGSFLGQNRIEGANSNNLVLQRGSDNSLTDYALLIKTSDTDIDFDVYRYENGAQTRKLSYTITMTATYTSKISVGLLNTWLANPTYSLVTDPANTALSLAKASESKNRGFVTIFATLYTSPITLIKYYIDRKKGKKITDTKDPVADFQRHAKNHLYTRPVWERIYPTVGVGISDRVFQNLFFGLNWEFTRGGSFFAGGHYGRVNVFNAPATFQFEKTNITQEQFNLYSNNEWKTGWTIGASIDFSIIGNLFK